MDCIQCYSKPKQPRDGWYWICEECFNTMDAYAWVGKEIQRKIEKDGTISIDEIDRLFRIAFDTKKRFDKIREIMRPSQSKSEE